MSWVDLSVDQSPRHCPNTSSCHICSLKFKNFLFSLLLKRKNCTLKHACTFLLPHIHVWCTVPFFFFLNSISPKNYFVQLQICRYFQLNTNELFTAWSQCHPGPHLLWFCAYIPLPKFHSSNSQCLCSHTCISASCLIVLIINISF